MDLDLEQCLDFLKALNGVLNLVLECTLEYSVPGDFDSESVPGDFARRRASGSRRSSSRAGRRRWVGGCCSTSGRARRGGAGTSTFSTCRMVEREKCRQWHGWRMCRPRHTSSSPLVDFFLAATPGAAAPRPPAAVKFALREVEATHPSLYPKAQRHFRLRTEPRRQLSPPSTVARSTRIHSASVWPGWP
jgi:hypothetical protein